MALTCEEIRDRFSDLREGELSPSEQAKVKSHLEVCFECRREFARFDKTLSMLHAIEEVEVPEGFLSGIYEKIEERRRKGPSSVWTFWKWPSVPNRLKLPIQALAMVAIVFLTLYLTKMMPGDLRMRGSGEPKSSLSERKKEPAETKPLAPEEKRLDQVSVQAQKQKDGMEDRNISGSLRAKAPTKKVEDESSGIGTETPAASPPGAFKEERLVAPAAPTTGANRMEQGLARPSAPIPGPGLKGAEVATPLKKKEAEDVSGVKGAVTPWPEPSEEFVLKIADEKKTLSHLRELVEQFGGETLNAERNRLLVYLPNSSLAAFRKELEAIRPLIKKPQQQETSRKTAEGAVAALAEKGREDEEKNRKTEPPEPSREGRTLIRIILIEE